MTGRIPSYTLDRASGLFAITVAAAIIRDDSQLC